jgi:hypothetical protein
LSETAAVTAARQQQATQQQVDPEEARRRYNEQLADWEAEKSKQRRPLYTDVEVLVTTGFLSHQVRVGSSAMSLRSLSPGDTFLLNHRCGLGANNRVWKAWTVATSIWMVDGMCLLGEPAAPVAMYQHIRHLPTHVTDILFANVLGLYNRTSTALGRTEAFCYEPYSRALWRMCGRNLPSETRVSGVHGASNLGLNYVQRTWMAFNIAEDDREQMLRDWAAAKLIASATSPKGVKKLNAADQRLQEREESRRRELIDSMVRYILHGAEDPEVTQPWRVMVQGQAVDVKPVKVARTDDELDDQFRRWVAGEKDWHDIIVDVHKERIRERFDHERRERADAIDEVTRRPGVTGGTGMVAYTLDQLKELRSDLLEERPRAKKVFDGHAPASVYEKYVKEDAGSGVLRADEHGVFEQPVERPETPTLQEKIAGRRPALSTDPIGRPSTEEGD